MAYHSDELTELSVGYQCCCSIYASLSILSQQDFVGMQIALSNGKKYPVRNKSELLLQDHAYLCLLDHCMVIVQIEMFA